MPGYIPSAAFDFTPGSAYTPTADFDFAASGPATLYLTPGADPVAQAVTTSPSIALRLTLAAEPSSCQFAAESPALAIRLNLDPASLALLAQASIPALTISAGGLLPQKATAQTAADSPALARVPGPLWLLETPTIAAYSTTPALTVWELNDRTTGQLWPSFG